MGSINFHHILDDVTSVFLKVFVPTLLLQLVLNATRLTHVATWKEALLSCLGAAAAAAWQALESKGIIPKLKAPGLARHKATQHPGQV